MVTDRFASNPGGVSGWGYEEGMEGNEQPGMIRDMAELVGLTGLTISGNLRSSHLDPKDALIVSAAIEDTMDHLAAPCNAPQLQRILKAADDEDYQTMELHLPATGRYALTHIHASMSGTSYDLILQMFIKQFRESPFLASTEQETGDSDADDVEAAPRKRGFFNRPEED